MKTSEGVFGLSGEVMEDLSRIFAAVPQVDEVIIFGSRAKGGYSEGSDIDLAVKGSHVNLDTILDIKSEIEELGLLYKVDVLDYDAIRTKEVVGHIDRMGKLFWKRNGH